METGHFLKKLWMAGCVVVFLTASLLTAEPKIKFDNEFTYDFGTARQDQVIEHTFKFTNVGDDTLIIQSVKSSCGCTGALMSNKNILPGDSGELVATFNIGRRKGRQNKTITVRTNDPTNYAVKFALVGDIFTPIDINPMNLLFSSLEMGKTDAAQVTIKNNTEKTIIFDTPKCEIAEVKLSLSRKQLAPQQSAMLMATYTPDASVGRLLGTVNIPVLQGEEPDVVIRLFGYVKQQ
ncbi:DUF1573 domain-containing protein [candidate division KSB1 bacterium]|nr:DUF1573 domain-containing protein [candidate division KSB1 bacterium]